MGEDSRSLIRDRLATCSQAGDARRADAYAACYAADGVLAIDPAIEGREAIRAWMAAPSVIPPPGAGNEARTPGFVSHHLTTCRIDLTGVDAATARTYWMVVTAIGLDHSGYYDDRLVRQDGVWLIAHRRPRTLWYAPASLVGPPQPSGIT